MKKFSPFYIFLFVIIQTFQLIAQTLPVGLPLLEDAYRRAQLLGESDQAASFSSRPFFPYLTEDKGYKNTVLSSMYAPYILSGKEVNKWKPVVKILPLTWKQQLNSDHPEGLNDGAMIPARGYQTYLSGGLFARAGWFSLQLKPEFVWAQNSAFDGFPDKHPDTVWKIYYAHNLNAIDIPERFGKGHYKKMFLGQSSFRITVGLVSLGLSNENLWWGPGYKNSLLMTNCAPGFKHITLNTVRPIKTWIGSFEGQIVAGKLEQSGFPGIDSTRLAQHGVNYTAKPIDWRYKNGMVLTYQPRWLPGLFLGVTRSFIVNWQDQLPGFAEYIPVIAPMTKKNYSGLEEDTRKSDQLASAFMRWVAPESHMEVYVEYGREDHSFDLTDVILEPSHVGAYLFGFRKLVPIKTRTKEYIDIQVEVTQLDKSRSTAMRAGGAGGWYTHHAARDGYSHLGQYLGAGIGTGGNMQWLSACWNSGMKRLGLEVKRVAHNNDFWAYAIKDYRSHWVDFGGGLFGEWNIKRFLLNARIETIGSINYMWLYDPIPSDPPYWWDRGKVRYNVHAELGISYCF